MAKLETVGAAYWKAYRGRIGKRGARPKIETALENAGIEVTPANVSAIAGMRPDDIPASGASATKAPKASKKTGGRKKGGRKAKASAAQAATPAQTAPAKRRKRATVATPQGAVNVVQRVPTPPMSDDDRQHIVDLHKLTPEERRHVIEGIRAIVQKREIEKQMSDLQAALAALPRAPTLLPPGVTDRLIQDGTIAPGPDAPGAPGPDAGQGEPDRSNDELLPATQRRRKRTG